MDIGKPSSLLIGKAGKSSNENQQALADKDFANLFAVGFNLMLAKRYAEAYSVYKNLQKTKQHAAVSFNLALCCIEAEEYNEAIAHLGEARQEAKQVNALMDKQDVNQTYMRIREKQNRLSAYKNPIDMSYPSLFNELVLEQIICLEIDIYVQLKMWPMVLEAASVLEGKNFANVLLAVSLANSSLSK